VAGSNDVSVTMDAEQIEVKVKVRLYTDLTKGMAVN